MPTSGTRVLSCQIAGFRLDSSALGPALLSNQCSLSIGSVEFCQALDDDRPQQAQRHCLLSFGIIGADWTSVTISPSNRSFCIWPDGKFWTGGPARTQRWENSDFNDLVDGILQTAAEG